jgi:hypothetical protein
MAEDEEDRGEADTVDVDAEEADSHPLLDFHSPLVAVHRADIRDSGPANFDYTHIHRRMRPYLPLAVNLTALAMMVVAGPLRCQAMKVDRHEVVAVMTDRNSHCTTAEEDTSRRRNRTVVVVAHDAYVEGGHSGVVVDDGDVHKDRIRVLVVVAVVEPPNWEDLCSGTVDILVVAEDGMLDGEDEVEVDGYDEEVELEKKEVQVVEHCIDEAEAGHDVVRGVDKEFGVEGEVDAGEVEVDEIHVADVEGAVVIEVEGVLVVVADVDLEEVESDDEIVDGHIEGHDIRGDHNTTEEVQGLVCYSQVQMGPQELD